MSVNMLLLCCSCLFFFLSSFDYSALAHMHVHKPSLPLFFLRQLYISVEQRSPSFLADTCRADAPSYFLNMFV